MLPPLPKQPISPHQLSYLFVTITPRGSCKQWVGEPGLWTVLSKFTFLAQSLISYVIMGDLFMLSEAMFPICKMEKIVVSSWVVMKQICTYHFNLMYTYGQVWVGMCMCVGGAISICYLSIYIYTYAYRDTNICACVIYVNVYTSYIYKTIYTFF